MMVFFEWLSHFSNPVTICALLVSITALVVATKNYRRKSGLLIRGGFVAAQSIECDDRYISTIVLENMKDRGVTIYSIYFRVGHNYYIELENFDEKPLVLKAYETYQQEFGPVQFYGINGRKVDLNSLLSDKKITKRLVISTGDGKYVVPKLIEKWNPIGDFFRNHLTVVLRPIVARHKGKYIGSNVKFIVEFNAEGKKEEIVLLQEDDFMFSKFKNFRLTRESLESKETLENFFTQQKELGNIKDVNCSIYESSEWTNRLDRHYSGKRLMAEYYNWYQYYINGRFFTWLSNRKLKKQNFESSKKINGDKGRKKQVVKN